MIHLKTFQFKTKLKKLFTLVELSLHTINTTQIQSKLNFSCKILIYFLIEMIKNEYFGIELLTLNLSELIKFPAYPELIKVITALFLGHLHLLDSVSHFSLNCFQYLITSQRLDNAM